MAREGPGDNKSVVAPLADLPQAHSQEVNPPRLQGWGLGGGGRQPDVSGPAVVRLCAGSGGRGCPGASKRRKGGSSRHLHCARLAPAESPRTPWRAFLAFTGGARPAAFRQVVTGQGRLDLPSCLHAFTHSCTHQLSRCGRHRSMIPRTFTVGGSVVRWLGWNLGSATQ